MMELEFRNVDFYGGRKTGEPGEKPSKQGRESKTNSTTESGSRTRDHSGERQASCRYTTHHASQNITKIKYNLKRIY
jgi:hypothetical protein